ncbi:MAG: cytochrome c oxidase accessory protein CcoG [Planctomycetota bacterium]
MAATASQQDRVLSTLNADGSRRWLKPRPSGGRWLNRRRIVGYGLIALFVTLPHLRINGKPPLLLDIPKREFTFFGGTLYATDIMFLAPLMILIFVSIFFLTALFGRVWCGWACPQTVYLELVYRPIEYLFQGTPGKKRRNFGGAGTAIKCGIYFVISFILAHTFLSYFVGTDALRTWIFGSPLDHFLPFLLVVATTLAMLFDFGYFREQMCIVACPYGRFQSVMLDQDSLVIGYDQRRGEPRGKKRRKPKGATTGVDLTVRATDPEPTPGDCIDCHMCVTTCPTGIDIRDGLQLECVNCAQCIDACDTVMDKIGKPRGLIRYASQRALEKGGRRFLRPRVIVYPAIIILMLSIIGIGLVTRSPALLRVVRGPGLPYIILEDGRITNSVNIKIHNRSQDDATYRVSLVGADGVEVLTQLGALDVPAGEIRTEPSLFAAPKHVFNAGRADLRVRLEDDSGRVQETPYRMLGPRGARATTPSPTTSPTSTPPQEDATHAS